MSVSQLEKIGELYDASPMFMSVVTYNPINKILDLCLGLQKALKQLYRPFLGCVILIAPVIVLIYLL